MTRKSVSIDLLQEKERRLTELEGQSDKAVQMFQTALDKLSAVNKDIETTMNDIDTYVQRLTATKDNLSSTHSKNAKIMQNFANLLCVE